MGSCQDVEKAEKALCLTGQMQHRDWVRGVQRGRLHCAAPGPCRRTDDQEVRFIVMRLCDNVAQ